MIIKDGDKGNPLLIVIPILLIALIAVKFLGDSQKREPSTSAQESINSQTSLFKENSLVHLLDDTASLVMSDSNLNIYLVEEFGLSKLYYFYKKELNKRQREDLFSVHVFLKDSSYLRNPNSKARFENLDFFSQPIKIENEGVSYFVFSRSLKIKESIPIGIDEIDYIETGRFAIHLGRSESYRLDSLEYYRAFNLNSSRLRTYCLHTNEDSYQKILLKREQALSNDILLTEEDDFIRGKLSDCDSEKLSMKFRLKGDWTDHLNHPYKWSFRVVMDDGNTFNGMRKFSFQHPRTRFYLWEWLFNKVIKEEQLIGMRYDFCNLILKVETEDSLIIKKLGIMAIEESFDKLLIEDNKRRTGVIIGFDESFLWNRRAKQNELGVGRVDETDFFDKSPIKVYNQNKVLSDANLLNQFTMARSMLDALRNEELSISEVFDLDKLTTFTAISNLFGATHGLHGHNIRMYFNPITTKLEPIAFDAAGGQRLSTITHYPFASNDKEYKRLLLEKLKYYGSESFVKKIDSTYSEQLKELLSDLNLEFEEVTFQSEIFSYNSNIIKSLLNPADIIRPALLEKTNNQLTLDIENLTEHEVRLIELKHIDGKRLDLRIDSNIIQGNKHSRVRVDLKPSYINAFVSKRNKNGSFRYPNDVDKLIIVYEVIGVGVKREVKVLPYVSNLNDNTMVLSHKERFKMNVNKFDFVSILRDSLVFREGSYSISESIVIADSTKLYVEPGFELNLLNNASIISFSAVNFDGRADMPIRIYSSDSTGGGLFVSNTNRSSRIEYCFFNGLSNPKLKGWEVSGTINFHESDVSILNSQFSNNRSEDLINIIRSQFSINNSIFSKSFSDAFDGDFVKGSIQDSKFIDCGNDAIDISGSTLMLENILIEEAADKAISAGEKSSIVGNHIKIKSGEIGVVCKDLSKIDLTKVEVLGTRLGAAIFQKKPEFGTGELYLWDSNFVNNEKNYLVEKESVFMLNGQLIPAKDKNVGDQLYGINYGKSSK